MLVLRKADDRFHTQIDWLDSWHTFSFGEHHDLDHMGFGPLRVINDDRIRGGGGFPTHGHRDMEIITIVLSGALEHKDSIGTGSVIRPGDVQKMSAGTGILHSEFNASQSEPVHLLQLWIMPNVKGVKPQYQQIHFEPERLLNRLCLVASPDGSNGSISLYQDARLYVSDLQTGKEMTHSIEKGRKIWVHAAEGTLEANGMPLKEGDGLAVLEEQTLSLRAKTESKILLFDLAA